MFYQYFTNKTNNAVLKSNQDFVSAELGTVFKKSDGSEYIKTDTIVFDKSTRSIRSDEENDQRYGRTNYANVWSQSNTFNAVTKILQSTFNNKTCLVDGQSVQHTNLTIPDITVTHDIEAVDSKFQNMVVSKSLSATCRPVFDNLTVNGNTKSNTLNVTQDSVLNKVSATGVTCTSVDASSRVNTNSVTASVAVTTKDLSVTNNANVTNKVTCKDLSASNTGSITTLTSTKINCNNIVPTNTSSNVGSSSNVYANMYATNFNGTALRAKYADLAEKYTTDLEYPAGTVLQINVDGDTEMTMFNGGTFAGVVSDKPAIKMNSQINGQYIALKGRVPVRCKGVVQKGMYCVAVEGGVVRGYAKSDLTPDMMLNILGVALSDSKPEEIVEVKL